MAGRAAPTIACIKRAVKAARECGVEIGAIEVTPEGGVRIIPASEKDKLDDFAQWERDREKGRASAA